MAKVLQSIDAMKDGPKTAARENRSADEAANDSSITVLVLGNCRWGSP